ncbi:MAG: glycoside hydrolase family 1 protein [Candidatus Omnitrophota bacterium]
MRSSDNSFPPGFLWGAATSPHQVEGDNRFNDWWAWETADRTAPSGKACDHYHRFREDFGLAKQLGHNAHRMGIEWSRLEKIEGAWDDNEWDHYRTVINELIRLGIEPIVTLNHFTVPAWFARKGGWLNDTSAELFARFASKAVSELGRNTRYWITINEPHILAILGYFHEQWPPGGKNFKEALIVIKNMLKGHVEAYCRMNEAAARTPGAKRPKIGIAKAVTAFHPCVRYSPLDLLSTHWRDKFHNHGFFNSALKGRICLPGLRKEKLPVKNALDFIGLNYYFRQFIRHEKNFIKNPFGNVCSLSHHPASGKITDMGWEIYPEGLYESVKIHARYRLPIIITENGIATKDDPLRQKFLRDHLSQLLRTIGEGAPVKGYIHWALLDNFEWGEGYTKRFGLIAVDFHTQKRTVRNSAKYYASVIRTGRI